MKRILFGIVITIIIILANQSNALYVNDGSIVLLRSQYLQKTIIIDGVLNEDSWSKAGFLHIIYNDSELKIYFTNDNDFLYMAIETTDTVKSNNSVGLYFDTDADGVLTTPEDAKILNYTNAFTWQDLYWSGNTWAVDQISNGVDADFNAIGKLEDGMFTYELKIALVASNVIYDGFQITNPSNTIVSFTVAVSNNQTRFYNFPTVPTNASGFVDLKLAGAEDQDLPMYIPPTTYTEIHNPDETVKNIQAAPGFGFAVGIFAVLALQFIRRRRK